MATKKIAKKADRKTDNKFDFKDSIKSIKGTAKTVNKEMMDAAEEVAVDLKENSVQIKAIAVKTVKDAYNTAYDKVTETVTLENITKATKTVNAYTLKTAEEVVDGAIVNSEKLHKIATKAVKGSLKLAGKQQDIVFDTLETVKGQLANSVVRFKKIFSAPELKTMTKSKAKK